MGLVEKRGGIRGRFRAPESQHKQAVEVEEVQRRGVDAGDPLGLGDDLLPEMEGQNRGDTSLTDSGDPALARSPGALRPRPLPEHCVSFLI